MTQSSAARLSARSVLIAGISTAVVGGAVLAPTGVPALSARVSPAFEMASITTPLELAIKNTYNAVEPWAAYGAAWGQYILGVIPGLWWLAPGVSFGYYTAEPLVRAGTYSFADAVGLNFAQIGPDISNGINTSINNGLTYGLAWLNSLVPLPPIPPIPPLPGASVPATAAAVPAAIDVPAAALVAAEPRGIESAIKNTYNAIEPWAAYGAELSQWVLSLIPGLWWVAPGVSLAYYSVEPLVQAGVYSFADALGLNFGQIGPDISTGINQSVNNFVNYGLAWINSIVPLPPIPPFPPLPGAAVPNTAAAVDAPESGAPAAVTVSTAPTGEAPAAEASVAEAPAPATEAPDVAAPDADAVDALAEVAQTPAAVATTGASSHAPADQPSGSDDSSPKAQRPARTGRG